MSRFDYVAYDTTAAKKQANVKAQFVKLDDWVQENLATGRAKDRIFDKLEEAYMWVGKAVRDEQVFTRGPGVLQEERNDDVTLPAAPVEEPAT